MLGRDFATQVVSLNLDQIGQDIVAVLIHGGEETDAEGVDLERDRDLAFGEGIVRIKTDVREH